MDNNSEPEYDSEAEWSIGTGSVTDSDAFGQDWSSDEEFIVPKFSNEDPQRTPVSDVPKPNGSGTLGRLLYDNRVPLDIVLETLQYLKPGELVALARTCKQIRSLLLSGQLTPVWKASRARYGIPPPPPERSEIAWAQFLFGRKTCHHCELAMAKVPDWQLMCRLCSECKRLNLLNARAVKYEFKDHHPDLTRMVLYTNVRKRYARSETAYYWREDLEKVGKIIKAQEADIAAGKPGAQEVFEEFKESRKAYVEAVMKHVPICEQWAAEYNESRMYERILEKDAWRAARMHIIEQRLQALGHHLDDIRSVVLAVRLTDMELTERCQAWQAILPDLARQIKQSRKRRLDASQGPLIEERKRALKEAYAAKRKSVSPRQWRSITFLALPPLHTLLNIPSVFDFVYSDADQNLGVAEFRTFLDSESSLGYGPAEATAQYDRLMSAGAHAVVSTYPSFLTDIGDHALLDCALLTYVDSDNDTAQPPWYPNDCTDLSTILCRRFFGAGIGLPDRSLEYCPRRAQAVASILELLHLPATTTVAELDARDARFDCMICRPGRIRGGGWQKRAHRWRSAVIHHALDHQRPWQTKSDPPRYVLLSDEKAAEARVKEGNPIDLASIATWFCAHCGEHLDNWKPYADVEKHVKDAHHVASPQREDDILYMPMVKIHPEAVMISCDPLPEQIVNCRCLLCPENGKKKTKVFSEEGVRCHLSTTHRPLKLEDGVEGVHFTRSA